MGRRFSMNRKMAWWLGWAVAAFWGLVMPALGGDASPEVLRVEALSVPVGADWRRGPAEREQEDDVFLLSQDELQVMLMRRAPLIKGNAESYYSNLTRYWRAQYGKAVLIDWLDAAGVRWLYLRRPTRESGGGVFQLSTVFDGRAYSLLVFVPGTMTVLSAPAMRLLADMRLGAGQPDTPIAPEPEQARATPSAVPPEAAFPAAPSARAHWVRADTFRLKPSADALEAVVSVDVDFLGRDGMLTGYGLDYGESSVDWFMEGFEWKTVAGRVTRVPWATRGRLEVDAPAELEGDASWTLRLRLPEGETGISARLAVWDLCAPAAVLADALAGLNRGIRVPMERLAAGVRPGCPTPETFAPSPRLQGEAGKMVAATWTLPRAGGIDAASSAPIASETALTRVRLVEVVLEPGAARAVPGDGLLERARLFFAYAPR